MRALSAEEDGGSYATLNGNKETVDIKISSAGSVMSMKRTSDMARDHQPNYGTAYDEPAPQDNKVMVMVLTVFSYILILITFPISFWFCIKVNVLSSASVLALC